MLSVFRVTLLFLIISSFSAAVALASHDAGSSASAAGSSSGNREIRTCPGCNNEIEEGDGLIQCEQEHTTHTDCLIGQVTHSKNLKENGLRCLGTLGGSQCTQRHPFETIVKALDSTQIDYINRTLVKKELKKLGIQDEICAICLQNHQFKKEIVKLSCACKEGYCPECIERWLREQKDGTCPTCREKFDGLTTHHLDESLEIIDPRLTQRPALGQVSAVNAEQAPAAAEVIQTPQNEGVPQLMRDVNRENPAFAALGYMHEAAGLIWSGVAPGGMNWQDATDYCAGLGGGARLPTKDEYEALSRAMSPGGHYNPNLFPNIRGLFWSSSLYGEIAAFYFNGNNGDVRTGFNYDAGSVRCVSDGRANPQVPAQVPNAEQAPAVALQIAQPPQNEGIPQSMQDVQRVNAAFAALGNMHEAAGLIWSGVVPQAMNWQQAINFCANLGGGARLPTRDEYRALSRSMSPGGQYHANLLPDTRGKSLWSSSSRGENGALYLHGNDGNVYVSYRDGSFSVRCVRDGRENPEARANVPNVLPAPPAAALEILQAPQNEGVPQLMQDLQRVNPAFAALGNMHEAAGLIWSAIAAERMNWQDAINYCAGLGGGARLPTVDEFRALKRAMSPGGAYNANLLPDTRNNGFWSSSPHGDYYAFFFSNNDGNVAYLHRNFGISVHCVMTAAR